MPTSLKQCHNPGQQDPISRRRDNLKPQTKCCLAAYRLVSEKKTIMNRVVCVHVRNHLPTHLQFSYWKSLPMFHKDKYFYSLSHEVYKLKAWWRCCVSAFSCQELLIRFPLNFILGKFNSDSYQSRYSPYFS
jgi:hypothetical protein